MHVFKCSASNSLFICLIFFLFGLFVPSCSKQITETEQPGQKVYEMYAVKVSGEVDNADIALFFKDGSYILCDINDETGEGTVYYNPDVANDFEDGLTVFIDSKGVPKMIASGNRQVIIHTRGESIDMAFIDTDNSISYAFDVDIEKALTRGTTNTKAWYSSIIGPFVNSWDTAKNFDWSWDEHQAKAIVPFLCKVVSFGITGASVFTEGPFGAISLALTLGDEISKSNNGYDAPWGEYVTGLNAALVGPSGMEWSSFIKEGKLVFSKKWLPLSMIAFALNQYGDEQLKRMGEVMPLLNQSFGQEWQIKLDCYSIDVGPEGGEFSVYVSSKTGWIIDDSSIDKSWCNVEKKGNNIIVKVSPYEIGVSDRFCYALITSPSGFEDRIPSARLSIKQTGVVFELSSSSLSFSQYEGNGAVSVSFNDRIASWEVTSYPEWCKASPYPKGALSKALLVIVEEDPYLLEYQEGTITATAYISNTMPIHRYLCVKRVPIIWDKTAWSFEPNLSIQTSGDAFYGGGLDKITVSINDAKTGLFSSSFGWNSMSLDSKGKLTFKYKGTATRTWTDDEGKKHSATMNESATLELTRIDENRAHALVSGHGTCTGELSGSVSVSGQCDGTRIGFTKSEPDIIKSKVININIR